MYNLVDVKNLSVTNEFIASAKNLSHALGAQLKSFIMHNPKHSQLDVSALGGLQDSTITLAEEISSFMADNLNKRGLHTSKDIHRKYLYFYYLLSSGACYVELPKYTKKDGVVMSTFDKYICTTNTDVIAEWLGVDTDTASSKYSPKLELTQLDIESGEIRLIKLTSTQSENKVSVPRKAVPIKDMNIYPLYMLKSFVDGFIEQLNTKILRFSYLKDNNSTRVLETTLSKDIISDYYTDQNVVNRMLTGIDYNSTDYRGIKLSSVIHRGYIRLPELGSSIYDETNIRSLNLARIVSIEEVKEVDRSYINVDLNSALANFERGIEDLYLRHKELIPSCYNKFMNTNETIPEDKYVIAVEKMLDTARNNKLYLTTTYNRVLHKFMIDHPEFFPTYIGRPVKAVDTKELISHEVLPF